MRSWRRACKWRSVASSSIIRSSRSACTTSKCACIATSPRIFRWKLFPSARRSSRKRRRPLSKSPRRPFGHPLPASRGEGNGTPSHRVRGEGARRADEGWQLHLHISMSDDFVDAPPAGADAWRELWQRDRRYRARPSKHEWLLKRLRRLFRRAMEPDAERQQNFNVAVLDLLDDIRNDIASLRNDVKSDIAAVQNDVRAADEALAGDVAQIRELIPIAAKRNDALIAALDQKIETLAVRIRDAVNPSSGGQAPRLSGHAATPVLHSDILYRRLEDGLRGSEHEVRGSLEHYAELARAHPPLFDVGCGRGELLALCRDIDAKGCDTNERSVADLEQRGFDVALAGVPECFANLADASLGSIAALHF